MSQESPTTTVPQHFVRSGHNNAILSIILKPNISKLAPPLDKILNLKLFSPSTSRKENRP